MSGIAEFMKKRGMIIDGHWPKVMTRNDVFQHLEIPGHKPKTINPHKIKCYVYKRNSEAKEIYQNFVCNCGRLFIVEIVGERGALNDPAMCPCESCIAFIDGACAV